MNLDGAPGDQGGGQAHARVVWALLALVVLGAFLRFYRIGFQSLWIDEILSLGAADVGEHLSLAEFFRNVQGPFHAALVHLVGLASASETALRSISAVAGIATIPVVYLLGRDLAGDRAGLAAGLLTAISPFAVWYSQEIRNYALLMFVAAVATLLAYRLVERGSRSWGAYGAAVVIAGYCSLSAVFLAAAHWFFAAPRLVRGGGLLRRWVVTYVVVVALMAPLGWSFTRWVGRAHVVEQATLAPVSSASELLRGETTFSPAAVPYAVFAMGYGFSLGPGVREMHEISPAQAMRRHAAVVVPAGLVLVLAIALGLRRLARDGRGLALVLWTVLVPLAGTAALSLVNVKPFNARYAAVAFPSLVAMVGAGVGLLRPRPAALLLGVLVALSGVALWNYYERPEYWKEDVRSATAYVSAREKPGDVVLVPVVRDVFNHYYGGSAPRFVFYPGQAGSEAGAGERIEREAGGARRIWYVASRLWEVDPGGNIEKYLRDHYVELDQVSFPGVEVSLFGRGQGGAAARP